MRRSLSATYGPGEDLLILIARQGWLGFLLYRRSSAGQTRIKCDYLEQLKNNKEKKSSSWLGFKGFSTSVKTICGVLSVGQRPTELIINISLWCSLWGDDHVILTELLKCNTNTSGIYFFQHQDAALAEISVEWGPDRPAGERFYLKKQKTQTQTCL